MLTTLKPIGPRAISWRNLVMPEEVISQAPETNFFVHGMAIIFIYCWHKTKPVSESISGLCASTLALECGPL